MLDPERYNEQPWPEHPARHADPHRVARLHAYRAELADLKLMCAKYGATVIRIEPMPIIPAFVADVLCMSGEEALALQMEWFEWCETSPRRLKYP